ncbi:hypothetical protein ACOSP7_002653 [Xanthoceras sorbifolium]
MKPPTRSVKDQPPPLPQATRKPYTTLKHQKTENELRADHTNTTRNLPVAQGCQEESRSRTPGRKQIEDARKNTYRDQDSRSKTAQKNRSQPTKKKDGTKLLGARSNNSKLPWPLLTESRRRRTKETKRDGQRAAATEEEELP